LVARLVRIEKVRGSIPLSSTDLVIVRTAAVGVVVPGGSVVAGWLWWSAWGMRKIGVSRSGAVMVTLAMRASTSALVCLWVPLVMISVMWLTIWVRVAGSGVVGSICPDHRADASIAKALGRLDGPHRSVPWL
jgi:hypothetical protein